MSSPVSPDGTGGAPKGSWPWLLKAALTGGLLYLVFTVVPLHRAAATLRSTNAGLFGLACLVSIASSVVSALRMKRLTDRQGMTLTARRHLEIGFATAFYGLFLPGFLSGGVFRWHRMSRPDRNAAGAFAVVVLNRFLTTTAAAASGVVFFAAAGASRGNTAPGLALAAILAVLLATQAVLVDGRISARLADAVSKRQGIPGAFQERIARIVHAFDRYRGMPPRSTVAVGGLCLAEEALGAVSNYLVALSVGVAIPFADLGWIRSCVNILTTIPVSVGGFGLREGSLILLLSPLGVPPAAAVAYSLLLFTRNLAMGTFGGIQEAREFLIRKGRGGR